MYEPNHTKSVSRRQLWTESTLLPLPRKIYGRQIAMLYVRKYVVHKRLTLISQLQCIGHIIIIIFFIIIIIIIIIVLLFYYYYYYLP